MINVPVRAFVIGVFVSELMQWGFWLRKNPGKSPLGYFRTQVASLIANVGVNVAVCVLWSYDGLDAFLQWVAQMIPYLGAKDWAESGVPYTPQVGLILGCMSDFFGDDVAYNLVQVIKKRLPGGQADPQIVPEPAAQPGDTK